VKRKRKSRVEESYIEDESFVVRTPSQTASEMYVPNEDQYDCGNTKNVSNVSERNSTYTQSHLLLLLLLRVN
jgi:hypothetical protein